jgi:hypothetical protein
MKFIVILSIIGMITYLACSIFSNNVDVNRTSVIGYGKTTMQVIEDNNLETEVVSIKELLEMIK